MKSTDRSGTLSGYLSEQEKQSIRWIIKSIPGCIYYKDVSGFYFAYSSYLLEESKINGKVLDIINKTDYDFFPKEQADKLRENDKRVMSEKRALCFEEEVVLPNGDKKYYQVIKSPLWNEKGEIAGVIGNSIDMTDKKTIETLEKENYAAQEKIGVMQLLAASIAHELRTPITAAQFAAMGITKFLPQLLQVYYLAQEKGLVEQPIQAMQLKALENVLIAQDRQLRNCHHIIDIQLKNISVHQVTKNNFAIEAIEQVIHEAIAEYPMSPEQKGLITNKIANQSLVFIDRVLFKHVIWNLLKNAFYFIAAAGKGDISLWSEEGDNTIIIYLEDTGKGLSDLQTKKIFEKFYTQSSGGTGLGLSFCQLVIEASGGQIFCEGREGEFTRFKIILPKQAK